MEGMHGYMTRKKRLMAAVARHAVDFFGSLAIEFANLKEDNNERKSRS